MKRSGSLSRKAPLKSRGEGPLPGSCPVCGGERSRGAHNKPLKTCGSRDCSTELIRRSKLGDKNPSKAKRYSGPRNKWGQISVEIPCEVCGATFLTPQTYVSKRRTCSHACAAVLKRKNSAGTRKEKANPNYKTGKRTGVRDREGERRWYADLPSTCQNPACANGKGRLHVHHCVYAQAVVREGGDKWDPRNRLLLCSFCHLSHHKGGTPLPIAVLPDSVFEFGAELLGPEAAFEYIKRRYAGNDPRHAALLL